MPFPCHRFCILLPLIAASWFWPGDIQAQQQVLNRCAGPGGNTIYTDRPCDTVGATERLPRSAIAGAYGLRRGGCARNLQDLIYEITAAVDNHDVNRLGAVYHWVGLNAAGGERVLDRLQAIVDRPLVDIVPLRTAANIAPDALPAPVPGSAAAIVPPGGPAAPAGTASTEAPRPAVVRGAATVGLRLEQTLGKGSTPSRTVLGLRRHFGCWWITL